MTDPSTKRKEYSEFLEQAKLAEQKEDWDQAFNYYLKAGNTLQFLYKCKCHPTFRRKAQSQAQRDL